MSEQTLGTAYVQIVPSAQGISGSISKVLGNEASAAGTSAGSKIASKIKGILATAAIGETLRQAIMEGAALEQSLGGIETLFKEHADIVKKNASQAYKNVGMSANEYMENATSFAASLLQSVNQNTEEAAKLTDMALIDMADNANKMGTSMDNITNAYQGFAKQNYTMLDNLKLGYGGTKTEMERLLADASKLSGIKYDINNLADVYSAIHVIQEELGITGTTSKEAAETLAGSFAAMKAAVQDFMGNIVLGRDVGASMAALAQTACTFFFNNLLPALANIIAAIPVTIYTLFVEGAPMLLDSGLEVIQKITEGLSSGLPDMINKLGEMLVNMITTIKDYLPKFLASAGEIVTNFVVGLVGNLPKIIEAVVILTGSVLQGLVDLAPMLLTEGFNLVANVAEGIIGGIASKLNSATGQIKTALTKPIETAKNTIKSIIDKIKSFFNITLSFKGIKLPHIDLSWKTDGIIAQAAKLLGVPGVPKFTVNWYKSGGIFDNPSIIGVGEAGTEAVVPLDSLWQKMDEYISKSLRQTEFNGHNFGNNDELADNLDSLSRTIVYAISKGFEGIGLKVDRRELGRFVKEVTI